MNPLRGSVIGLAGLVGVGVLAWPAIGTTSADGYVKRDEQEVDLVLNSPELGATAYRGRFTAANRIEGTFDPSGEYEMELTLDRD